MLLFVNNPVICTLSHRGDPSSLFIVQIKIFLKNYLSTLRNLHVWIGQDELADRRVEHEALDAVIDCNHPVRQK